MTVKDLSESWQRLPDYPQPNLPNSKNTGVNLEEWNYVRIDEAVAAIAWSDNDNVDNDIMEGKL